MTVIKSIPVKKIIHNDLVTTSETSIVSENQYQTNGESFILIKDTLSCKIKLDSRTTEHVTIKTLTNVIIIPDKNPIDEEWDELNIGKGTCIELRFIHDTWYILSSDGLKLS
jgi:hypothetical protein